MYSLIEFFLEWKHKTNSSVKLLLVGGENIVILIIQILFLPGIFQRKKKVKLYKNALLLVNPSHLESFPLLLMESWLLEFQF